MIHFKPVEHHIEDRAQSRLCDGEPANDADISSEDWFALRDARKDVTLCPDCQDKVNSRDVWSDIYGYERMSTAHLYSVPVLAAFDAIRNCSHCRRNTDDDCKAWREARGSVAVLTQEARRFAKGVDELRDATGGRTVNIYQFGCGSVAYFAPDFQEAGELKGDALTRGLRVLDARGAPGGNTVHETYPDEGGTEQRWIDTYQSTTSLVTVQRTTLAALDIGDIQWMPAIITDFTDSRFTRPFGTIT